MAETPTKSSAERVEHLSGRKRKPSQEENLHGPVSKVPKTGEESDLAEHLSPIEYWTHTGHWPHQATTTANALVSLVKMSQLPSSVSSKRRSSSIHRSQLKRQRAEQGVFMKQSQQICQESKEMCEGLIAKNHELIPCILYPEDAFLDVMERVEGLNEARIQRDLMPRIVPPAEILRFHGEPILPSICEELDMLWLYCEPKGGSIPKPDYTAGLSPDAFSPEEIQELQIYSSCKRPFLFTPNVCFPFLTCEAKSGDQALSRAKSQNLSNGSIAVGAIIELYKEAFGKTQPQLVTELYGKVLVFSVSHDNEMVVIWGHYAVVGEDGKDKFYYHLIDAIDLLLREGRDRNKPYWFVRNVYDKFVPEHLERIKTATAALLSKSSRRTILSSDLNAGDLGSQPDAGPQAASEEEGPTFRIPNEPASTARVREVKEQMEQQRQESKEKEMMMVEQISRLLQQVGHLQEQLEQQRKESKEQLEQQRKENREQLEQQRKESKEQLEKMMEIMSKLQAGPKSNITE